MLVLSKDGTVRRQARVVCEEGRNVRIQFDRRFPAARLHASAASARWRGCEALVLRLPEISTFFAVRLWLIWIKNPAQ